MFSQILITKSTSKNTKTNTACLIANLDMSLFFHIFHIYFVRRSSRALTTNTRRNFQEPLAVGSRQLSATARAAEQRAKGYLPPRHSPGGHETSLPGVAAKNVGGCKITEQGRSSTATMRCFQVRHEMIAM